MGQVASKSCILTSGEWKTTASIALSKSEINAKHTGYVASKSVYSLLLSRHCSPGLMQQCQLNDVCNCRGDGPGCNSYKSRQKVSFPTSPGGAPGGVSCFTHC